MSRISSAHIACLPRNWRLVSTNVRMRGRQWRGHADQAGHIGFSLHIAYVDPRGKQSAFEVVVMFKTSASTSKSAEKAALSEDAPVAAPFVAELALDNMKDISGTANTVLADSQLVVSAVTTTKAQYAIWEPMMEKVEGLVNIVDGIAAVS